MNINEQFPSKFLKASDLQGAMVKVKIRDVTVEEIGTDRKLIMYFDGKDKGMVLNKTNARTIGDVYGDDTDGWVGAPIEIFSMKVDFQGRMVDGLRVRVPPKKAPVRTAPQAPPDDGRAYAGELDDEIPF